MPTKFSCPLSFHTLEPCARRGEPVSVGLPWPRGAISDEKYFQLIGPDGSPQLLQSKVLDRWPDGSVRWCLFDFLATWDGKTRESGYSIVISDQVTRSVQPSTIAVGLSVDLETSWGKIAVYDRGDDLIIAEVRYEKGKKCQIICSSSIAIKGRGTTKQGIAQPVRLEKTGPIRMSVNFRYNANDVYEEYIVDVQPSRIGETLEVFGRVEIFDVVPVARVTVTVRNPAPASHPGGNWDLGSLGTVYLGEFSWTVRAEGWLAAETLLSTERGKPVDAKNSPIEISQESSGGDNWNSSNHVDRYRKVPLRNRGYKVVEGESNTVHESRATPIVGCRNEGRFAGLTMPTFWENFPKSTSASRSELSLNLFPQSAVELHEFQGGEQKTHTFYVAFGKDTITDEPMVWCRSPIVSHASPEWYAATGAIEYLTPKASDPHAKYLALVDQAIEGPDTFLTKRETIDEYGWRNFGDIYGDHEAVGWAGKSPMISHYNNQYDCVAAFLIQFFRSGDTRWLSQGIECADHTCDIDIYHTDGDKAAYNRGLFWHTYHYADADTGTHRSYPKSLTRGPVESLTKKMDELGETAKMLKKSYAVGGGPASSHNYNAGLMLGYFLTGNTLYRDTAIDLANFVINMENPAKTPFRYLSREYTGLATESGGGGYHGPGRAAANSILALIVGHQLTGESQYLEKAEQLICRVVHPKQNLERLDLLNAELRWFYTMTLQSLGRYLDYKIELGQLDRNYAYARLSLLHYARWMATNERPILDTPEKLQYPNETWAAQDMRKVEVFQYAAKHASGTEKAKYLECAGWYFDYVQDKLSEFETKSLCRPVILMMKYGWSRNWWRENPMATAPETDTVVSVDEFGEWSMFVPQKAKAMKRAKLLLAAGVAFVFVAICATVLWFMV